jgi:hypothetical protein
MITINSVRQKLKITHSIMNDHPKNKNYKYRGAWLTMCLQWAFTTIWRLNNVRNIITRYIKNPNTAVIMLGLQF